MSYKKQVLRENFLNGKFDETRLRNQVKGLFNNFDLEITRKGVDFVSPHLITKEQDEKIDLLVSTHDGSPQQILIKDTSNHNRLVLQEVVAIAADRPDLKDMVNGIVDYYAYMSSIGLMETYVYFGERGKERFVSKLIEDVSEVSIIININEEDRTEEQVTKYKLLSVLLTEVTPPNEEYPNGVKAYEYLIGKIEGAI